MKKIISTVFILLFMLIILFSLTAWFFGKNTEESIVTFIGNEKLNTESIFKYELLNYERSIFGAKATISIDFNSQNKIALFFEDLFINKNTHVIDIDIYHGPILFKFGLNVGGSILEINAQNNLTNETQSKFVEYFGFNEIPFTSIFTGFDNEINYQVPFLFSQNKIIISGKYNLNSNIHSGTVVSKKLKYKDNNLLFQVEDFELLYKQIPMGIYENSQFVLTGDIPKLSFKHRFLSEQVNLNMSYQGDVSLEANKVSSDNMLTFKVSNNRGIPKYPIDKGSLNIKLDALNLNDLSELKMAFKEINYLQHQIEWLLEEQAEYPEGQDQIWQKQDKASQYYEQLPELLSRVLKTNTSNMTEKQIESLKHSFRSRVAFQFISQYLKQKSTLNGAIYPTSLEKGDVISKLIFSSLIQTEAEVSLDDEWFQFLSGHVPIKKPNFKLIYKQNKLLMQ